MHATLTEIAVRAATPEQGKTVTMWDGSLKHFGVRISPGGTKTFVVLLGSGRRHAIGRYPTISLAQARTKAGQLLAERTLGRFLPKTITWDSAVDEYIAVCEHKTKPRTSKEYRRALKCCFGFGSTRLTHHEARNSAKARQASRDAIATTSRINLRANVFQMGTGEGLRRA